jgi:hypothetical protein
MSGKRAATSPLNSEFYKRLRPGLSDEELQRLNKGLKQELEEVITIPISTPDCVESTHLVRAFREVAIKASNVDKSYTDRDVCMGLVERLSTDTIQEFASLWITARNKGDWSDFANYCALLPSHHSATVATALCSLTSDHTFHIWQAWYSGIC